REAEVAIMEVVDGQSELLEVVGAFEPVGGLAHLLDGGQEQANQHGNDGNHHQQLDEREAAAPGGSSYSHVTPPLPEEKEKDPCWGCFFAVWTRSRRITSCTAGRSRRRTPPHSRLTGRQSVSPLVLALPRRQPESDRPDRA